MSKIQREVTPPKQSPEPQKSAGNSGAAPFTPAPPKPRQSAAPQGAAASPQRQHAKTVRQARTAMQAVSNERPAAALPARAHESSTSDPTATPNASTRFDSGNGNGLLPVEFFADFAEAQDGTSKSSTGAMLESLAETAALDAPLDTAALARLLPPGDNDGIFDVILPTGDHLGVVVSGRSSSLSYLLSPSTDKFGSRLRRHKMELEERLEQLTHRNVNITVL
jgi:hypothetical protein